MGITVVPKGALAVNNTSGLAEPGGILDRLTQAMDNQATYTGTLRGLAPSLQASGIPVAAPSSSILSQLTGGISSLFGLGGQQQAHPPQAPQMPVATASAGAPAPQAQPTASGPATSGPNGVMGMFGNAVASIESAGSGGYSATGPVTKSGDQALGKYQVMASNVGPWTKEVLGQELSPQQFLASPQAQDAVFSGKFGQYLNQTGSPRDAASMWFTGKPYAQGAAAQDQLGTTGAGYVSKFMAALPGGGGPNGAGQGGVPAGAMAYAPGGGSGGGSADTTPMPQATATGPQPAQSAVQAASNMAGGGQGGAAQGGTPASPGQVLGPLMANPATRQVGAQLWQGALQQGGGAGMPGSMTLPAGMTPQALAAMIAQPQTMQMGLEIWQRSLYPTLTKLSPNESLYAGTRFVGQAPSAPMDLGPGHRAINPNVAPGAGGVIASVPPEQHIEPVNGRLTATDPQTGVSRDITPAGVPTTADLKGTEAANQAVLDQVTQSKAQAIAATRTIDAIGRQQTALDQGAYTGGGAALKLKFAQALSGMFGIPFNGVAPTQEFIAAANSKAAELAKQLSNAGHTTNADINIAKIMSGADPNYSLTALRSIGSAQQQLAMDTINRHNASVAEGAKWNPALAQRQGFFQVPVPTNQYDFAGAAAYGAARDAISRGADPTAVRQRLQGAGFDPAKL